MVHPTYVWRGASSLRCRLVLEEPLFTPDGAGGIEVSYRKQMCLWACVMSEDWPSWGRTQMDRKESIGHYRIIIRWCRGITITHRFRNESRIFKIIGTEDPDGYRQRLVCMAEAYLS